MSGVEWIIALDNRLKALEAEVAELKAKARRQFIPVAEAARIRGVSPDTIRRHFATVRQGRRAYVRAADLES